MGGGSGTHQSWQFAFPDFVGSNAVVVRDTGGVQKSYFRPFGEFEQFGGGLTPYLFTDQEHDPETDLQYFGARYYDPWIGRFLSPDPALIGARAGITFGRLGSDPQQFNLFSYARNNPTKYVDPSGLYPITTAIGFINAEGNYEVTILLSDLGDAGASSVATTSGGSESGSTYAAGFAGVMVQGAATGARVPGTVVSKVVLGVGGALIGAGIYLATDGDNASTPKEADLADTIADHATESRTPEEMGFDSQEELAAAIRNALDSANPNAESKEIRPGVKATHDSETGLTIIENPSQPDGKGGTVDWDPSRTWYDSL